MRCSGRDLILGFALRLVLICHSHLNPNFSQKDQPVPSVLRVLNPGRDRRSNDDYNVKKRDFLSDLSSGSVFGQLAICDVSRKPFVDLLPCQAVILKRRDFAADYVKIRSLRFLFGVAASKIHNTIISFSMWPLLDR